MGRTCARQTLPKWGERGIKDPKGALRFWGVKFNGIMTVFVRGQTFNWFTGQKAQPEPLLHSLSQLQVCTLHTPSGKENHFELMLTERHYFWQMTDILLFRRVSKRLQHIIISSEHSVPNEALSSFSIKGIYCSSWVKLSFSLFSCTVSGPALLSVVALSGSISWRVKVTPVWLGWLTSVRSWALWHKRCDRQADKLAECFWVGSQNGGVRSTGELEVQIDNV